MNFYKKIKLLKKIMKLQIKILNDYVYINQFKYSSIKFFKINNFVSFRVIYHFILNHIKIDY